MNQGLDIFKRAQHLAEGTTSLNYDPSYPGPTNPHESGSGYWTSRLVGTGVGTASNFFVPGLGLLTGPIASWAMRAMQSGMSQNAVQNAVKAYQTSQTGGGQSGDTTTAPATDTSSNATAPTTSTTPSAGIGIDPFGNPADPGEFWSNDFGRWGEGDQYGTTPGNYNPPGPGGGIGTRGVWGGQTTIPIASDPNFTPSLGWAMPAASGGGAYGGNTMAKIALHSGTFRDAATPEQWAFMQNYLSGGGGGGGSGQGVGGAGRPMTQSVQRGSADIGLKMFKKFQDGSEAVPSELPSPPEEDLTVKRNSMSNLRPAMLAKALGEELRGLSKEDVAKMVVAGLLTGGEGGEPLALPPGAAPKPSGQAYSGVSDQLMGYPKPGREAFREKGYAEEKYSYTQPVKVIQPDGDFHYDEVKGLNKAHALERARRNWDGATIEAIGEGGRVKTEGFQMGTSSVNPGLKLFHAIQKRKKK